MSRLTNFLAFQAGWFACVLAAAHGLAWAGTAAALIIVGWHVSHAPQPRAEAALVLICAFIGALWDSAIAAHGWIEYESGVLLAGTAPHWIVALWMLFAITLNGSLSWLKHRVALAAAFGAAGGPLAYLGGEKLGALAIVGQAPALAALVLGWAAITPLLLMLAQRFNGFGEVPRSAPCAQVPNA